MPASRSIGDSSSDVSAGSLPASAAVSDCSGTSVTTSVSIVSPSDWASVAPAVCASVICSVCASAAPAACTSVTCSVWASVAPAVCASVTCSLCVSVTCSVRASVSPVVCASVTCSVCASVSDSVSVAASVTASVSASSFAPLIYATRSSFCTPSATVTFFAYTAPLKSDPTVTAAFGARNVPCSPLPEDRFTVPSKAWYLPFSSVAKL